MFRTFAAISLAVVVLAGGTIGYVAGVQSIDRRTYGLGQQNVAFFVRDFYATLGQLDDASDEERLAAMLAPEFTEQRVELQQTLDREDFLQAIAQEYRSFPRQRQVPVQIHVDAGWTLVVVHALDTTRGSFASIELAPSNAFRQELLKIVDGRILERIVLEGNDSSLRSLPVAHLEFDGAGKQTIEIVRRRYDPHALERLVLDGPGSIVVEAGSVMIGTPGTRLEAGDEMTFRADDAVAIENDSDVSASLLVLTIVPIDMPRSIPSMSDQKDAGPGVTAQRIGQSTAFLPAASCFTIESGLASLAPGNRLPRHRTGGYEFLIPLAGRLDATTETNPFLRTDSTRSWQDETPFATVENGIALAASPGSWTAYSVTSDEPALAWVFAVTFDAADCPYPATSPA